MNMVKKNLAYLLCAGVGVLNFILLIIPYVTAFVEASGYGEMTENFSGYQVMSEFWSDLGFSGVMIGLLQIFVLIAGIALLAIGALGLLESFGVIKLMGNKGKNIAWYVLVAYAVLNLLLLVFLIVFCVSNTEEGFGASAGFKLSAGIFVTLVVALAAAVLPKVPALNAKN